MASSKSNQVKTQNVNFKLDQIGCYMGIIDEFKIIQAIDEKLPKNKHNVVVSNGQLAASLILYFLSPLKYIGLSASQNLFKEYPLLPMLGCDENVTAESFNRFALGRMLDAIVDYGTTKFSTDILSKFFNGSATEVMHLDSTSRSMYKAIQEALSNSDNQSIEAICNQVCRALDYSVEENGTQVKEFITDCLDCGNHEGKWFADTKTAEIRQGLSKDNHPELGQVCVHMLSCKASDLLMCLPAYEFVASGNRCDRDVFAEIANHHLDDVLKVYPNLKTIVADSAASTPKFIVGCKKHNINACVRLVDNYKDVKAIFNKVIDGELTLNSYQNQNGEGKTTNIELLEVGEHIFTDDETGESVPAKMVIYRSNSLRDIKTKTINKQAEKEKSKVQKAIKKLSTKPCACKKDAHKQLHDIIKNLKFVSVSDPVYEEVEGYTCKGRPSKNSQKAVIACKVQAQVSLNQEAIDRAIEKELLFVLCSTDLNKDGLDIYNEYHEQSDIEGCWRELKAHGVYIDNFFLVKNDRIQALIALETIALSISRIFKSRLRQALRDSKKSLRTSSGKLTKTPSNDTINHIFLGSDVGLSLRGNKVFINDAIELNPAINFIIRAAGPNSIKYYQRDLYQSQANALLRCKNEVLTSCESVLVDDDEIQ